MEDSERNQWREADRLFQRLNECNADQRKRILESGTIDDAVRAKVAALLESSNRAHRLLDGDAPDLPWFAAAAAASPEHDPLTGRLMGDWKLIEPIGSGGMATVYRAERVGRDFRQEAAVKLLHIALRGDTERRRFHRERRILAQLQHPHIAGLVDAGFADDATPYIAMPLIQGKRIDRWCDDEGSTIRERVELLLQVCETVAHAHRQLIVHRDIKPGNILVDASGHVTLLDFGIARLLDADDEQTVTLAFTPGYAAPEQRGGQFALGTGVDVYGVGAVLHRLLTGAPPRHDSHGDPVPAAAIARERDDAHAAAALRGDLDAVLALALAADPRKRYGSVAALAGDLRAWLHPRPLRARRITPWTRLGKFVRRNRAACALALLAVLAAVAGLAILVFGDRALERRAAELQAVASFQAVMLDHIDLRAAGNTLRASLDASLRQSGLAANPRESLLARTDFTGIAASMLDASLLHDALATIRAEFAGQPAVEAVLLQSLAGTYHELFKFETALPIQRQATALAIRTFGPGDRRTLASMRAQVRLANDMNAPDVHALALRTLAAHQRYLGDDDIDTALARATLGDELIARHPAAAESELRAAYERLGRGQDHVPREAAKVQGNLAVALAEQGKYAAAEPVFVAAIEAMTGVPDVQADSLDLRNMLAWVHGKLGQPEHAHAEYQALYPLYLKNFGEFDPRTLNLLNNIAAWPRRQGDYAAAEAPQRKAYRGMLLALGPSHPTTVRMQMNLAEIELHLGKLAKAKDLLDTALAQPREGDSGYDVPRMQFLLGETAQARGDEAAARRWFRAAWSRAADPTQSGMRRDIAAKLATSYRRSDASQAALWQARAREPSKDGTAATRSDPSPATGGAGKTGH
jgi:serine/threonine-protein kinase